MILKLLQCLAYYLPSYFYLSYSGDVDLQAHKIAVWVIFVGTRIQGHTI